jgi:fructoselysine 6-kinase
VGGFEFATVGDNCIDRFLPPVDDCLVGGNAVNVAVQLALLGRRVGYFGAVGADAAGQAVIQSLRERNVDVSALGIVPGQRTAYTDIEMSEDGDRTFVFEDFGACAGYRPSAADILTLRGMRHIHIGWLNDGGALKAALGGLAGTLSQDLTVNNSPENLSPSGLDIGFRSAEPAAAASEAHRLLGEGARVAVITMGAAGSLASDGRITVTAPAPLITPEDTTGAGDAFIAGFIDAFADGASLAACLSRGTERAGLACLHRGGFAQPPLKGIMEPWAGSRAPSPQA